MFGEFKRGIPRDYGEFGKLLNFLAQSSFKHIKNLYIFIYFYKKTRLLKMKTKNLSFMCIMVKDPKVGGYTAFFKQLPHIIAEGETTEEAFDNLINAMYDIFIHQNKEGLGEIEENFNVIQKTVNLTFSEEV